MDNIGELIKMILEKRGMWFLVKQQEIIFKWPIIAGEQIAGNTEAVKIIKGVLWIKVKNSVWMHHLAMLKPQIIKKANQFIKNDIVKDIYFFIGDMSAENKLYEPEKVNDLVNENRCHFTDEEISEILKEVDDEGIKEKIKSIMKKGF